MRTCPGNVDVLRWGPLVLLVGVCLTGGAMGELQISPGLATVDGDLREWAGANWIAMNDTFYSDPSDVTGAKFAARWTPDTILRGRYRRGRRPCVHHVE